MWQPTEQKLEAANRRIDRLEVQLADLRRQVLNELAAEMVVRLGPRVKDIQAILEAG